MKSKWPMVPFKELVRPVSTAVCVEAGATYREIGIRSHGKGIFHKEPVSGTRLGAKAVFEVVPGCLVFNIVFAWEGAVALTSEREAGYIASHRFPQFAVDSSRVAPEFLLLFMLSKGGLDLLKLASPGGAGRNKTLGRRDLGRTIVPVPPMRLQHAAVRLVRTSGSALTTMGLLLESRHHLKRALLRRLILNAQSAKPRSIGEIAKLNPSESGPQDGSDVPFVAMADVEECGGLRRIGVRASVQIGGGTTTFRDGDVLVAKITPCFENGKGALVSGLNGCVGFGSTEFHVLRANADIDPDYLFYATLTDDFRRKGMACMTGSAGQRRVPSQFLRAYRLNVPKLRDQRRASALLRLVDREIALLRQEKTALLLQKRAVMQKLLSGEIELPEVGEAHTTPAPEAEMPS